MMLAIKEICCSAHLSLKGMWRSVRWNSRSLLGLLRRNRKLLLRNNDLKFHLIDHNNDSLFSFSEWPLKSLFENNNRFKTMKKCSNSWEYASLWRYFVCYNSQLENNWWDTWDARYTQCLAMRKNTVNKIRWFG